jgi:hypothetical protein
VMLENRYPPLQDADRPKIKPSAKTPTLNTSAFDPR